jgi:hypothetical protein
MALNNRDPRESGRRWKRVLGGVVAAALFLPVPVLALTFLGSWQIQQNQTGGAPAAAVTFSDTSTGGMLSIDMKSFSMHREASSTVTATRNFSVHSPSEAVTMARSIEAFFKHAFVDVKVTVQRVSGSSNFSFPEFKRFVGSRPQYFAGTASRTQRMNAGTYKVIVSVQNVKASNGSWNTVSPYKFTFNGVTGSRSSDYDDSFNAKQLDNPFFVQPVSFE